MKRDSTLRRAMKVADVPTSPHRRRVTVPARRNDSWPSRDSWNDPATLYKVSHRESWGTLPVCRPLDHTMFHALDEYVAQKLPTEALYEALLQGHRIEVHGIHPAHLPTVAPNLGLHELRSLNTEKHPRSKVYNFIRPGFFTARRSHGEEVLVAAVVPGRDYVRHYAGLVRHFVHMHTSSAEERIEIHRYPVADGTLPRWSRLDEMRIPAGGTVIVGYVDEVARTLRQACGLELLESHQNDSYGALHYRLANGRPLTLLGVKFSFWGSISAALTRALCQQGVDELIYIGKLGALDRPEDVYSRIFSPSQFVVLDHREVVEAVSGIPNRLLDRFPELDTHCHISVPTVIEEDYVQRKLVTDLGALSIDNEISQMAATVHQHNALTGQRTSFSALHFATDYVRSSRERSLSCPLDLSNNRTRVARSKKEAVLRRILHQYLCPYLGLEAVAQASHRSA
ncbi:MAG: hypothetical protein K0U98_10305 [Deltaproteobacteria bacterium]|nr:hypothetical protein [Deltaproteobacteria bacterium]